MYKFGYNTEVVKELRRKQLFDVISLCLDLLLIIIFLYLDTEGASDDTKTLTTILIVFFAALFAFGIYGLFRADTVEGNIKKNCLEISSTHVSGVYTNHPKSTNNEKYFKLEFSQIDKLELKSVNVAANEFWTLYIYSAEGLYKMAINDARKAGSIIYKEIFRAREAAKAKKEENTQKAE